MTLQLPGDVQRREVFVLHRKRLAMWLATVETDRLGDEVRPYLEALQERAADVLDAYFMNRPSPEQEVQRLQAEVIRLQAALIERLQDEAVRRTSEPAAPAQLAPEQVPTVPPAAPAGPPRHHALWQRVMARPGIGTAKLISELGSPEAEVQRQVAELVRGGWLVRRGWGLYGATAAPPAAPAPPAQRRSRRIQRGELGKEVGNNLHGPQSVTYIVDSAHLPGPVAAPAPPQPPAAAAAGPPALAAAAGPSPFPGLPPLPPLDSFQHRLQRSDLARSAPAKLLRSFVERSGRRP